MIAEEDGHLRRRRMSSSKGGRGEGGRGGGGGGRHYLHCERVVFEEKLVFLGEGFAVCAAAEAPEHGFRGRLAGQADESVGGSDNPPACESTRVLGFVLFCFVLFCFVLFCFVLFLRGD